MRILKNNFVLITDLSFFANIHSIVKRENKNQKVNIYQTFTILFKDNSQLYPDLILAKFNTFQIYKQCIHLIFCIINQNYLKQIQFVILFREIKPYARQLQLLPANEL